MKISSSPQFTPEQELLLWSIRVDHSKDQRIEEILKAGVDWKYVRETAIQHGIIPLLYMRLKKNMGDRVPHEELSEFRKLFMANAVQNLRMTQQLIKALDLLTDSGIEVMPFKGPALAIQAYGDLSMRSYNDLDILIKKADFDHTYKIFTEHGFIPRYPVNSRSKKKIVLFNKDFTFSNQEFSIEVHWEITQHLYSIPLNIKDFWHRSHQISINDCILNTLSPEDFLILLCIHGTMHFWHDIKWLGDLIHFIENNPNLKWHQILNQAEETGVRKILILGLFLAQEYGGSKFSFEIKDLFETDSKLHIHSANIGINFFNQKRNVLFLLPPIFYFERRERIIDRVKYGFFLFTDTILIPNECDFKIISMPELLFPIYIPIHQFRIIFECGKKFLLYFFS